MRCVVSFLAPFVVLLFALFFSAFACAAFALAPSLVAAQDEEALYARLERAAALIRESQLARAETELTALLRARPRDPNALNLLGVVRARQKRGEEAEQLFLRALRESPTLVGAYVNLGQHYVEARKPERALWALNEAARLQPARPDINYQLASLYEESGDCARSLEHLERIAREDSGVEHLYLTVKCYLALGRSEEALALTAPLKRPGAASPEDAASFAAAFAARGLFDHSLAILEAALKASPDSFALLYNLGAVYAQKNEPRRAEEFYQAALKTKPDDAQTLHALARLARARGDLKAALSLLARARQQSPNSPAILFDYGWTALNLDEFAEAVSALEQLRQKFPNEPSYLYTLAVARFYQNDDAEAVRLLERYIAQSPGDGRGHYLRGLVFYFTKQYAQARTSLARSFSLSPSADAASFLGQIAADEGQMPESIEWFSRAVALDLAHAAARAGLGVAYFKQKKYEEARAELERAHALDPQNLTAAYQLGLLYLRLGDKERAASLTRIADRLRAQHKHGGRGGLRLVDAPK
jgi:tetratricopeptide (TPR) repeat protein